MCFVLSQGTQRRSLSSLRALWSVAGTEMINGYMFATPEDFSLMFKSSLGSYALLNSAGCYPCSPTHLQHIQPPHERKLIQNKQNWLIINK